VDVKPPVEATIEVVEHPWETQERQHPNKGKPGISYNQNFIDMAWITHNASGQKVGIPSMAPVDCLTYRSRKGTLIGILYHYPVDLLPFERAGNVNTWVHPRRQRRGIGTALLREAMRRWDLDPYQQTYTPEGAALMNAVLRQIEGEA